MEPSELKMSIWVESYDEKIAENHQNCFELKTWKKIVLKFQVPILYTFQEKSCQRAVRSGRARLGRVGPDRTGSDRFIVLNDSASLKYIIDLDLNFFRFF